MQEELYDRQGNPITWEEYSKLAIDKNYRRVALTETPQGRISTVWLGINHNFGDGPPLIFETMIFRDEFEEDGMWRYATEEQALAGHERVVLEEGDLGSASTKRGGVDDEVRRGGSVEAEEGRKSL